MNLTLKKLDLQFDAIKHRYVLNGKWVPGVSSISGVLPKEWLAPWAAKMTAEAAKGLWKPDRAYSQKEIDDILHFAKSAHRGKKEQAAESGTIAHGWYETYVKSKLNGGGLPPYPEDPAALNAIKAFLAWEEAVKPEWVASELVVGSEKHQFAGKLDSLAIIEGEFCLTDFKTSNGIFPEYYVQTSGYQIGLEEMGSPAIANRWILRFPKEGNDFEARKVPTSFKDDKKVFLAAREIYTYIKKLEKLDN